MVLVGRGGKWGTTLASWSRRVPKQTRGLPWALGEVGQGMSDPVQQPTLLPDRGHKKDGRKNLGEGMRLRDTARAHPSRKNKTEQ